MNAALPAFTENRRSGWLVGIRSSLQLVRTERRSSGSWGLCSSRHGTFCCITRLGRYIPTRYWAALETLPTRTPFYYLAINKIKEIIVYSLFVVCWHLHYTAGRDRSKWRVSPPHNLRRETGYELDAGPPAVVPGGGRYSDRGMAGQEKVACWDVRSAH